MTATLTARYDASTLRRILTAATRWLELNATAVDALNVYPVPDGDTGTNMLLTMRSAMKAVEACEGDSAGAVVDALAHGALLGARGNSGVILSQIWRGLAEGLGGRTDLTGRELATGLRLAADRAYRAVAAPVEGTILTVARAAADAGELAAGGEPDTTPHDVLAAATAAAQEALRHTPEQLPRLKEAGVVDAGGQGLVLLLEGALAGLEGRELLAGYGSLGEIDRAWLEASAQPADGDHPTWGYCTQFIIEAPGADADTIRVRLTDGDVESVLVVGDARAVHVHLHTFDPGAALTRGIALGTLRNIKVDNMTDQNAALLAASAGAVAGTATDRNGRVPSSAALGLPVVAVVPGEGLRRVFNGLGVSQVVTGGQSMNPSVQQVAEAVAGVPGETVILLPNNPNVQLVCERVHEVVDKRVLVVPSHTVPQGIAALLSVDLGDSADDQAAAMRAALTDVRSIEITTATRTATVDGLEVRQGQTVGLLDRRLVAATASPLEALAEVLERADPPSGSLLTLYYGDDVPEAAAQEVAAALRLHPRAPEVELVWGGQPHYAYIASLES